MSTQDHGGAVMTPTPFYMAPETSRQLLEISRDNTAKRRIERELRDALSGFSDSAYAELADIHLELQEKQS